MVTPKLSRRNKASNHEFALPLSKALGCKRAGTEKDPLPIPARPCQSVSIQQARWKSPSRLRRVP